MKYRDWLILLMLLVLVAFGLWYTNPVRLFPECQADDVPRNCVD